MTITERPPTADAILSDELLERFRGRAAGYDRANTFFHDDFEELVALGYLAAPVPADLGGWDISLGELGQLQRRLARYAPSTALGHEHALLLGRYGRRAAPPRRYDPRLDAA